MSQVRTPLHGRAFELQRASANRRSRFDNHAVAMWRQLVWIAHTEGCKVREDDGRLVPVTAKWLLPILDAKLKTMSLAGRLDVLRRWCLADARKAKGETYKPGLVIRRATIDNRPISTMTTQHRVCRAGSLPRQTTRFGTR